MTTLCHFASASKFIYAYVVDCVFVMVCSIVKFVILCFLKTMD